MSVVQTVVIQTENGPVVINKSDYDEKKHALAGAEKPKRGRPAKAK